MNTGGRVQQSASRLRILNAPPLAARPRLRPPRRSMQFSVRDHVRPHRTCPNRLGLFSMCRARSDTFHVIVMNWTTFSISACAMPCSMPCHPTVSSFHSCRERQNVSSRHQRGCPRRRTTIEQNKDTSESGVSALSARLSRHAGPDWLNCSSKLATVQLISCR